MLLVSTTSPYGVINEIQGSFELDEGRDHFRVKGVPPLHTLNIKWFNPYKTDVKIDLYSVEWKLNERFLGKHKHTARTIKVDKDTTTLMYNYDANDLGENEWNIEITVTCSMFKCRQIATVKVMPDKE